MSESVDRVVVGHEKAIGGAWANQFVSQDNDR
jgi:hypothetical protein